LERSGLERKGEEWKGFQKIIFSEKKENEKI